MKLLAVAVLALAAAPGALAGPPQVTATLDRQSGGLGDPFRYTVEARAPGPGALHVFADTGPFVVVAAPATSRSRSGGIETVRIVQTIVCLDRTCAPGARPRRVTLPPARASVGSASTLVRAAAITLTPRVPASVVAASRAAYRRQVEVPPPSPAISPVTAAALLAAGAALLAVAAVLLVLRELRRRPAAGGAAVGGRLAGGLAEALRLLRESAERPAPDRRRAADYAARAVASGPVAEEAIRVAWSAPDPRPADVGALAERIESAER